jgi:lipoprotein-releasing system permease protein
LKLIWLIARKYFFSRKNPSAINIITGISMAGYAVGALALIILLSALNGFESTIFGGYTHGDADLKVVASKGKVFTLAKDTLEKLSKIKGVTSYFKCLEDKAIVKFNDQQTVALVRGVDEGILKTLNVDSLIIDGHKHLYDLKSERNLAWLSEGLIYKLNIAQENAEIELMEPDRMSSGISQTVLNQEQVNVSAMIHLGEDHNDATLYVPLSVAESLFSRDGEMSSLEIKINAAQFDQCNVEIQALLGPKFSFLNRKEQHKTMYKMFNTEKWVSFALLAFILLLISFNLFGAIRMMMIDKSSDLAMLNALGMRLNHIYRVFLFEGFMVAVIGSILGIGLGVGLVLLQQKYGFVTTHSTFAMAYPVKLAMRDIFLVMALNTFLALFTSFLAKQSVSVGNRFLNPSKIS